jgi:alpha-beta hydrolase superfamily lysophospholipase
LSALPLQAIAPDGTVLQVMFYGAPFTPAPGVILLHDQGQNASVWAVVAAESQNAGYDVFAPDQRGHGRSGGQVNWPQAVSDVQAVIEMVNRLGDIASPQFALIGAGVGANVALLSCGQLAACVAVVAISPLDGIAEGVESGDNIAALAGRAVFIVSADDDAEGTEVAATLNSRLVGDHLWQRYSSGGSGLELLVTHPELTQGILDWLRIRIAPARP